MTLKEQLLKMINDLPDEETTEAEISETGEGATEPDTSAESEPTETEIEPDVVEETEVIAPPVNDSDVTVVTSDDMLQQSIDMRLASFYQKQEELENTVKILLDEVNNLKKHFEVIETAIDTAAETSPTVESIENLINQL